MRPTKLGMCSAAALCPVSDARLAIFARPPHETAAAGSSSLVLDVDGEIAP